MSRILFFLSNKRIGLKQDRARQMIFRIDVYTRNSYIFRTGKGKTPLFMLELTSMDRRITAQLRTWSLTPKFFHCLTNRWRREQNCGDQFPELSWSWRGASQSCQTPLSRCSGRPGTGSGRRRNMS